jgi:hypothetical protein
MSRQAHSENGIIHVSSKYSVPETIRRLDGVVKSKRLTVFATSSLAVTLPRSVFVCGRRSC